MRQSFAEVRRNRIWNSPRPLPNEALSFETEYASPDAIQRNRNNRRVHLLHDSLEPTPKRKHLANPRDLAFGKDANYLPVPDGFARRSQRLNHLAWPLLRRN